MQRLEDILQCGYSTYVSAASRPDGRSRRRVVAVTPPVPAGRSGAIRVDSPGVCQHGEAGGQSVSRNTLFLYGRPWLARARARVLDEEGRYEGDGVPAARCLGWARECGERGRS